ncbi:MAG: FliH/SctL family protein [Pseudomonadota bacterium]
MKNTSESGDDRSDRWQAPQFPDGDIPTAGELEALQQQAYDEAYALAWEEGRSAGYDAGLSAGAEELERRTAVAESLIGQLQAPLVDLEETLEAELAEMLHALVARLFRRQIQLDPDAIVGLVRDAVRLLPSAANRVSVQVSPDDAERLRELLPEATDEETRWQIVSDPAIVTGGCRVICGQSTVDATIEARMQQLASSLIGDERL